MKKILLILLYLFFSFNSKAEAITEISDKSLWIKSASTEEVQKIFKMYSYDDYSKTRIKIPRIFMNNLPVDWKNVKPSDEKNKTFIRILIPLVLKVNEKILEERADIENINVKFRNGQKLSNDDVNLLEEKAKKYDAFTRFKGDERISVLLKMLLERIDYVPPSIMIASAAIYTDWGMSRLALEANSLYQEEVWYQDIGLKPKDDPDANYRYKIFNSLEESIYSHALKINSHINYKYMREHRKLARKMNRPFYGKIVVSSMLHDSNLKNIAGIIDYTFSFYKLQKTDYFPTFEDIQ
jgi:Bax protein